MRRSAHSQRLLSILLVLALLLPEMMGAAGHTLRPGNTETEGDTPGSKAAEAAGIDPSSGPPNAQVAEATGAEATVGEAEGESLEMDTVETMGLKVQSAGENGRLRFAPAIDGDDNPTSNPAASHPVPLLNVAGRRAAPVTLAARLLPSDEDDAPIDVPVTFRLWNDEGMRYEETVRSDAWGAVTAHFMVEELAGSFRYQASAPGYGATAIRTARFSQGAPAETMDGTPLPLDVDRQEERVTVVARAPVPLEAGRDRATLIVVRRPDAPLESAPTTTAAGGAGMAQALALVAEEGVGLPLPPVEMVIDEDGGARANLQLPPGDYAFLATMTAADETPTHFFSESREVAIPGDPTSPAETAAGSVTWISELEFAPGLYLAQLRSDPETAAFALVPADRRPAVAGEDAGERRYVQRWRSGPFQWQETEHRVEVKPLLDGDERPLVAVEDVTYDPVTRRYHFRFRLTGSAPLTTTAGVVAYGPGETLLHRQRWRLSLTSGEDSLRTLRVPAAHGRPTHFTVFFGRGALAGEEDENRPRPAPPPPPLALAQPSTDPTGERPDHLTPAPSPALPDEEHGEERNACGSVGSFFLPSVRLLHSLIIPIGGTVNYTFRCYAEVLSYTILQMELSYPPEEYDLQWFPDRSRASIIATISWHLFSNGWDLENATLSLGQLGMAASLEASIALDLDLGRCPSPEVIEAAEEFLSRTATRINQKITRFNKTNEPIGPTPKLPLFWVVLLWGDGSYTLQGQAQAQGLTISLTGTGSVDAALNVGLGVPIPNLIRILESLHQLYEMATGLQTFADSVQEVDLIVDNYNGRDDEGSGGGGGGRCDDDDPPDDRPPDDRQDVWNIVEAYSQGHTRAETISNLSAWLQRAEAQGLDRASRLLTLRLRQAEMIQFAGDPVLAGNYLDDLATILAEGGEDVRGIYSGTVPISPTQTITEAVISRLEQMTNDVYDLPYLRQERQVQNALLTAQQRYQEIAGQELALEDELFTLFFEESVGVLDSGFPGATLQVLDRLQLPARLISPWQGESGTPDNPVAYVSPSLAPGVVVVPSGGLRMVVDSPEARRWLEEYVAGGGILIVFSQMFGDDWAVLPGGEVDGVGYEEEKRWVHASVSAAGDSRWLSWLANARPDIQVDGAFSAWPDDAEILLRRTRGTFAGYPAMLTYTYGAGQVVATSAYGDWAFSTGFWWGDDWPLTRSTIIRAFLLAHRRDVDDLPTVAPDTAFTVTYQITNTTLYTATQVETSLEPRKARWQSSDTSPVLLGPGEGTTVTAQLDAPPVHYGAHNWTQAGLFRLHAALALDGAHDLTGPGPFVWVRPALTPPELDFNVSAPERVLLGETVVVTASVHNAGTTSRTISIDGRRDWPTGNETVEVPPGGSAHITGTVEADGSKQLRVRFRENGDEVGQVTRWMLVEYPRFQTRPLLPANGLADGRSLPIEVTNTSFAPSLSGTMAVTLTNPTGATVWSDAASLPELGPGQTVTPTFSPALPPLEFGEYTLTYSTRDATDPRPDVDAMALPNRITGRIVPGSDRLRVRHPFAFTLHLTNTGRFDVEPAVTLSVSRAGWAITDTSHLPAGESATSTHTLTLPADLTAGDLALVADVDVANRRQLQTGVFLPPAVVEAAIEGGLTYMGGDSVTVSLHNSGGVDGVVSATLRLLDRFGVTQAEQDVGLTVRPGETETTTLTIPAGAASGDYTLQLSGRVQGAIHGLGLRETIAIQGLEAEMALNSDAPAYLAGDVITAHTQITPTGLALDGSVLDLKVCLPGPRTSVWPGTGIGEGSGVVAWGENLGARYVNGTVARNWPDFPLGPDRGYGDMREPVVAPDGSEAYVPGGYGTLDIYDLAARSGPITVPLSADSPESTVLSPDGAYAYVGDNSWPGHVSVVDTAAQTEVYTIGVGYYPADVALNADGSMLYTANQIDNTISAVDLSTNQELYTVPVGVEPMAIAISPAGETAYILHRSETYLGIVDLSARQMMTVSLGANPSPGLAVAPDGSEVYVGMWDLGVSVVDSQAETVIAQIATEERAYHLVVSDDGETAYVHSDLNVGVIDLTARQEVDAFPMGTWPTGLAFDSGGPSPDDDRLIISQLDGFGIRVLHPARADEIRTAGNGTTDYADDVVLSRDGLRLYWLDGASGELVVSNLETGSTIVTVTLSGGSRLNDLAVDEDQRMAYVTSDGYYDDGTLSIIDLAQGQEVNALTVGTSARSLALSPGGAFAYVGGNDDLVIVDLLQQQVDGSISVGGTADIAVTPDGSYAYVARSEDIAVVDLGARQVVDQVGETGQGLTFGPLSGLLYFVQDDSQYERGWMVTVDPDNSHSVVRHISLPKRPAPTDLAFSDDEAVAYIAGSGAELISVVDVESGEEFAVLPSRGGYPTRIDVAGAGRILRDLPDGCAAALWETTRSLSGAEPLDLSDVSAPITDTGRLLLWGEVRTPTGQQLAEARADFYVHDPDTRLTLETDRDAYRPGDSVQATGVLTNEAGVARTFDLTVTEGISDQQSTLLSTSLSLDPGEAYSYSANTSASAPLALQTTARDGSGNAAVAENYPLVAEPQIEATLLAPDSATYDPFTATLVVTNTGAISVSLTATVEDGAPTSLALAPGQVSSVDEETTIEAGAEITAAIRGDVTRDLLKTVSWAGGASLLSFDGPDSSASGDLLFTYTISGTGQLPTDITIGADLVTGEGESTAPQRADLAATTADAAAEQQHTVWPGQSLTGTLTVEAPPGESTLSVTVNGPAAAGELDELTVPLSLTESSASLAPAPRLLDVTASPDPVAAGDSLTLTLQIENAGGPGATVAGVQLFDPTRQWVITPAGWITATYPISLAVPADLPRGDYFGSVELAGGSVPFTVTVQGSDATLGLALDQAGYASGEEGALTVTLTETAGVTGEYVILSAYLDQQEVYTITVPAGAVVQHTFPFTATESGRASVFLARPETEEHGQRVITLDSLPVHVTQPAEGVTLTFDKAVYQAGETIQMSLAVSGELGDVTVLGPMEAAGSDRFLMWDPPLDGNGVQRVVTGTYPLSYTLPTPVREGRRTFLVQTDGDVQEVQVDVDGWKVTTRRVTADQRRYRQQDTISIVAEFWNESGYPLPGVTLESWILPPGDGPALPLETTTRTLTLQPGLNVITATGPISSAHAGPHRALLNLMAPAGWRVAGAGTQFDVGAANLLALTTDQAQYEPGEAGVGRLELYGHGPADLTVTSAMTTSEGATTPPATLFSATPDLNGYHTFTFTLPTGDRGDYLLRAESVDEHGSVDQMLRAYAVPAPPDEQPPLLQMTTPTTTTVLVTNDATTLLTVAGVVSDEDSGVATLSINGEAVTPAADGSFSVDVTVSQGVNLVSAAAVDAAGNVTFSPLVSVLVVPTTDVHLEVERRTVAPGDALTFTLSLEAGRALSDVTVVLPLPAALVGDATATATEGATSVGSVEGSDVLSARWQGDLSAAAPVAVTIYATAQVTGTFTAQATAYWGLGQISASEALEMEIVERPAAGGIHFLPAVFKRDTPATN
ncbi:MAG: hypothetical protein R3248_00965 [Candidatus Promineifilaceae bacterium]|nr:hypothetical protein [Candidatus Promineifilaceae bacterium]